MAKNQTYSKDPVLVEIVHWANVASLETPITIIISGAVITGTIIGVKTFFDLYSKQWYNALENIDKAAADTILKKYKNEGEEIYNEALKESGESIFNNTNFIHMKDSKIIHGNQFTPTSNGVLWRGKISEISGFTVGTFSASK